ncbi:hypothetical protein GCM10029964_092760 [Kibdelosporangium lantanae]
MIPHGRTPIDRLGIAELHNLSWSQARNFVKPWAQDGHPKPMSGRGKSGQPFLWDLEQATAYAQHKKIPSLPTEPDPHDLLDRFEAAELAGVHPNAWEQDYYDGRVPEADARPYNVLMWFRKTVEAVKERRAEKAEKRAQAQGSAEKGTRRRANKSWPKRADTAQERRRRIAQLLKAADHEGTSSLPPRSDVSWGSPSTAQNYVNEIRGGSDLIHTVQERRQRIEALLESDDTLSAGEIGRRLGIPSSTVHRYVREIRGDKPA